MTNIEANIVVDAKGLSCPMPIVKTKKTITHMKPGEVLEVQATDRGSKADIQAWSQRGGHQYLGTIEDGKVLKHFIRKAPNDEILEKKHPHVIQNHELEKKLSNTEPIIILDVREDAEYAFNHIPGAISIPLGNLEERLFELQKNAEIYVICRTGNRSDLAAQILTEKDFLKVYNVVPGMSEWSGETVGMSK